MESKQRIKMKMATLSCLSAVYLGLFLQICLMNGVTSNTTMSEDSTTVDTNASTTSTTTPVPTTAPTSTPDPITKSTPPTNETTSPTTIKPPPVTTSNSTTDIADTTDSTLDVTTPANSTLATTEETNTEPPETTTPEITTPEITTPETTTPETTAPSQSTSTPFSSTTTKSSSTAGGVSGSPPQPPDDQLGLIVGLAFVGALALVIIVFVGFRYKKTGALKKTFIFKDPLIYQEPNPNPGGNVPKPEDLDKYPRSMPIEVNDLPDTYLEKSKNSGLLFRQEYGMISKLSPRYPQTVANLPENDLIKNRYRDIKPFDHNRVLMQKLDGEEDSDYVNASYIPGYKNDREYIACQGPTENSINDHWRMIWEQNIRIIVMVTKCEEGDLIKREKCIQYWPEKDSKTYGDITVGILSSEKLCRDNYKIRKLDVRNGVETRIVYHFQYVRWPDKQNPEDPEGMLEFRETIRDTMLQFESGPIIVHCSAIVLEKKTFEGFSSVRLPYFEALDAGVGRSGTYIAIDILLQHMEDHDSVDVYGLVLKMRNNRVYMVQTPDQYMFVHSSLLHTMDMKRKQEVDDGNIYINVNEEQDNPYENIPMAKKPDEQKLFGSGRKKRAVPTPVVSNSYTSISKEDDEDSPPPIPTKPGQGHSEIDNNENHAMRKSPPIPPQNSQTPKEIEGNENRAMKKSPPIPPESASEIEGYENPALTVSQDPIPAQNGTSQMNSTKGDNSEHISENEIMLTSDN